MSESIMNPDSAPAVPETIEPYRHTVHFYETDKMAITHHSNYIRWMEEARVDFLRQIGWDFWKMEALGIVSPVLSVSCEYKRPTIFPEEVRIDVRITAFHGAKIAFSYEMKNAGGDVVCTARSEHGFLKPDGTPVRMKREFPALYETILCVMGDVAD